MVILETLLAIHVLLLVALAQHQEILLAAVVQQITLFMEQILVEAVPVINSLTPLRPVLFVTPIVLLVRVRPPTV
jgi:hypothetical protein